MKRHFAVALCLCFLLAGFAVAYNPPVDKAGPLTVTIEGPEVVTETGAGVPVRVVIENGSDTAVQGTLELGLIDRWSAKPAEPAEFTVAAGSQVVCEFTVTAGEGTYNAHYPIHAFARFEYDGQSYTRTRSSSWRRNCPIRRKLNGTSCGDLSPSRPTASWLCGSFRSIAPSCRCSEAIGGHFRPAGRGAMNRPMATCTFIQRLSVANARPLPSILRGEAANPAVWRWSIRWNFRKFSP